jgi:hypothetical protein
MKRRSFLAALGATPAIAAAVAKAAPTTVRKYGVVDVARASKLGLLASTVYVDGVEAPLCYAFNDIEGWADCYVFGRRWKRSPLLTQRQHGQIEVRPKR